MFSFIKNPIRRMLSRRRLGQHGFIGSRKRRTEDSRLVAAADHSKVIGFIILSILWLFCAGLLSFPTHHSGNMPLVLKQQAPKTFFADFDFLYEDKDKTLEKKHLAAEVVPLYFKISEDEIKQSVRNAEDFSAAIKARVNDEKQKIKYIPGKQLMDNLVAALDDNSVQVFNSLIQDEPLWQNYLRELDLILGQGIFSQKERESYKVGQQIRIIDTRGRDRYPKQAIEILTPQDAAAELSDSLLKYYSSNSNRPAIRNALIQASSAIIGGKGNLAFDPGLTDIKKKEAEKQVIPSMVEIKKYQPLVLKGQVITAKELHLLESYEKTGQQKLQDRFSSQEAIRDLVWSLFLMIFIGLYMFHIHPEVVKSNQKLCLCAAVIVVSLTLNLVFAEFFYFLSSNFGIPPGLVNDAIPLALSAILLAAMLGLRVAIYVGFFTAAITAMIMGNSLDIAIEGLVICCISALVVRNAANYRSFFIRSVFIVFISLWILDFNLLWQIQAESKMHLWSTGSKMLLWSAGVSFINGFATATVALILIFIFEMVFNISTNMSLLMLSDYNHPLLKRLQLEAPGTFYHSLMVSTLAEYAAKEINANPIKARVGALFHDIGKLAKPEYFTENNINADKKHGELHPRMSSLIIQNHVKEGIDQALKYNLRKIIRDSIQQHHGTDIVYYFYKRALEDAKDDGSTVDEQEYRYSGPLPQDKEVVLISLADACEAASRSLPKPTPNKIETLVWEIFRKRIKDGQLDNAKLTIAELARIRDSFVKTLTTMYHSRIAYPKDGETDEDDIFMESKNASPAEPKTDKKDA
jgi:putative nucleotidyltransferase with HDIG domain